MKFRCSQQAMVKAFNTISKAVPSRTTMPILKGVLITAAGSSVILTASNLDLSIRRVIDAEVLEEGTTVVSAKLYGDIIRKLPGEMIECTEWEDGSLFITANTSEFRMITMSPEEFPQIGRRDESDTSLVLDKELFRSMVSRTSFAASIEEAKGVLTGILTELHDDDITMVTLDGFRLALACEPMVNTEENSFIISARIMNEIARTISEDDEDDHMTMYFGDKRAIVQTGRTEMMLRIMEGNFILYRDIIPTDSTTRVLISRELFADGVERASLLAKEGKNNLVKLTIRDHMMTITSRSEEGTVREDIPIDKEGSDLEIGFNSKYVMDVLKVIDDETLSLHLKSSVSPCLVRPIEGNSYEYLVLPVRIPSM